jgi:hypothetical protein
MNLQRPDDAKLFRTNYARLEDIAISELFGYYNSTIKLYDEVEKHIRRSKNEKQAIDSYMATAKTAQSEANYGVVFSSAGAISVANLVEIGKPVCKGGGADCKAKDLEGFEIRTTPGGAWSKRDVRGPDNKRVVPIERTELFAAVASGGKPELLSVKDYQRRLGAIKALATELLMTQKSLLEKLEQASKRSKLVAI